MTKEDQDLGLVRESINKLAEHFDSVQIFCTRYESNEIGTTKCQLGTGNWFARYGQVLLWIERENEDERCDVQEGRKEED